MQSMTPASIEENVPSDIIVEGLLGNLINGTGIKNQMISAYVVDSNGRAVSPATNEPTSEDESFLSTIKDVKLLAENNTYSLFIKPTSSFYSGLNITSGLDVRKHVLTFEDVIPILGTYFGVVTAGIAAFAFIPRIKKHRDENKERAILYKCIDEINTIYYSSSENAVQRLNKLKDKRNSIVSMFHVGELDEEHFKLLDGKISEYEQKLEKN